MVGAFLSLVALSRICTVVLLKVAPIGKAVCSEEIENRIFTFPIFFFFFANRPYFTSRVNWKVF